MFSHRVSRGLKKLIGELEPDDLQPLHPSDPIYASSPVFSGKLSKAASIALLSATPLVAAVAER